MLHFFVHSLARSFLNTSTPSPARIDNHSKGLSVWPNLFSPTCNWTCKFKNNFEMPIQNDMLTCQVKMLTLCWIVLLKCPFVMSCWDAKQKCYIDMWSEIYIWDNTFDMTLHVPFYFAWEGWWSRVELWGEVFYVHPHTHPQSRFGNVNLKCTQLKCELSRWRRFGHADLTHKHEMSFLNNGFKLLSWIEILKCHFEMTGWHASLKC